MVDGLAVVDEPPDEPDEPRDEPDEPPDESLELEPPDESLELELPEDSPALLDELDESFDEPEPLESDEPDALEADFFAERLSVL